MFLKFWLVRPFLFLIASSLILSSCTNKTFRPGRIAGFTQGTTYSIIFDTLNGLSVPMARIDIENILAGVDGSLSVYNDSSVISKLNRNEINIPDKLFTEVFKRSQEISDLTDGAFDITVMPLVRAWGFGPEAHKNFDRSKLDSLMSLIGYRKIEIADGILRKTDSRITVDVNAIAQGYTVDLICRYFDGKGITDYLVEVGGEVRVKGSKGGTPWTIGIDKPVDENMIPGADLQATVELKDKALATSGNYRKFYIEDGIKYSHTIDPKTGYPAKNRLLSATVIANDCATADAIATALMVMGLDKAQEFILSNSWIEAYLIYSDENGNFRSWISSGLKDIIS